MDSGVSEPLSPHSMAADAVAAPVPARDWWTSGYLLLFASAFLSVLWQLLEYADASYLWTDEIFAWWVAVHPSWSGLWTAMYRGSDGMFPSFYVWSWFWVRAFGTSEIMLRLPGILFACGGMALIFATIRRSWGWSAACASVACVVLGNRIFLTQAWQFRAYGMLLGLTAAAVYILAELPADGRKRRVLLGANAVTQLLLALCHPFGLLYCAALGGARMIASATQPGKRWDQALAWSFLPSVIGVLAWLPGMRELARMNQPRGWIPELMLNDLARLSLPQLDPIWGWLAPLFGGVLLLAGAALAPRPVVRDQVPASRERTLILLAGAILVVTPLAWVASQFAEPLLLVRYVVPTTWTWAIFGAVVWSFLARRTRPAAEFLATVGAVGVAVFALWRFDFPLASDRERGVLPLRQTLEARFACDTGGLDRIVMPEPWPIYLESLHAFLPRQHYNLRKRDYRLLLNETLALAGGDVQGASIDTKLSLKLVANGLPKNSVRDVSEGAALVAGLAGFYLVDQPERRASDQFQQELIEQGWKRELAGKELPHTVAGSAVVWRFTPP